jgi:hypothetical protein
VKKLIPTNVIDNMVSMDPNMHDVANVMRNCRTKAAISAFDLFIREP